MKESVVDNKLFRCLKINLITQIRQLAEANRFSSHPLGNGVYEENRIAKAIKTKELIKQ